MARAGDDVAPVPAPAKPALPAGFSPRVGDEIEALIGGKRVRAKVTQLVEGRW